jgi:hypothetical protein
MLEMDLLTMRIIWKKGISVLLDLCLPGVDLLQHVRCEKDKYPDTCNITGGEE